METHQTQKNEELKTDSPIKSKFQRQGKNKYVAVDAVDTDGNDEDNESDTGVVRLKTDYIELYQDDDGKDEKILVEKQVEFEHSRSIKHKCGYKCCKCLCKFRLILGIIILFFGGLGISYIVAEYNEQTADKLWITTTDASILLFCVLIAKLFTYAIIKTLTMITNNSRRVFYVKGMYNRLYLTILVVLFLIEHIIFHNIFSSKLLSAIICAAVTSAAFLCTHILLRYVALNSYFDIFDRNTKKLKADITCIEIMLNKEKNKRLFNMPIMNFLMDFPLKKQIKEAKQSFKSTVSFKFEMDRNHGILAESEINEDLYSIDLAKGSKARMIKETKLNQVSDVVSSIIMERLHTKRSEIVAMPKYIISPDDLTPETNLAKHKGKRDLFEQQEQESAWAVNFTKKSTSFHPDPLLMNSDQINEDIFVVIFKEYNQPNKQLLCELGQLAWKKLSNDRHYKYLNSTILKANIKKFIMELLNLKKSIDSYIVIINNLQLIVDIITPIILLFLYLRVAGFSFQEAIALYVSCAAIIGFFASSFFSAVFTSISFIVFTNPFLVGDYIMYDNEVYLINEISLLSCVVTQMSNRYTVIFQNKELSEASTPIINFTRSPKQKYKWTFYFKPYDIDDESIYEFVASVKEEIKKRIKYHSKEENIKKSFCTKADLDGIEWWTIKAKVYDLDMWGRKRVKVQMKFSEYSSHVQTLCFNCVTSVMKDFNIDADPLPIFCSNHNRQT